ncbi:MAG: retroviral-like aspartic protease family protein [Candidatus Omnitrophica bacterium]|nr:retroviral-like aspartic protease family protein [Candidatus Omnitrophota bacterium]
MLIDTGATLTTINHTTAEKLGLDIKGKKIQLTLADGRKIYAISATLDTISIGNIVSTNIPAVIIGGDNQYELLGMSFLKDYHISIDSERMTLTLQSK